MLVTYRPKFKSKRGILHLMPTATHSTQKALDNITFGLQTSFGGQVCSCKGITSLHLVSKFEKRYIQNELLRTYPNFQLSIELTIGIFRG